MRETVAIDLDDVVADTTDALRLYVNEQTGLRLTKNDYRVPATYWGYYEHVWNTAGIDDHSHIHAFHELMGKDQSDILPVEGASEALPKLKQVVNMVAVTSRELFMEQATVAWVEQYFPGVFKDIVLLGHVKTAAHTKGEACLALGATALLDDNIGHCETALQVGVQAVLFGDYGWQHEFDNEFPRCKNWQEVVAYFDERTR
jgi:5'(3')-deoxyribonucleotidase